MTKLHNLLKQVVNSKETRLNESKNYFGNIWLCFTWLVFFISMVACAPTTFSDDGEGDSGGGGNGDNSNGGGSQPTAVLTYSSFATFGESETIIPTKTPSQVASYTIEYAKVGTITPPSIDSRGVITTTASTTAGFYSIKAFDRSNSEITTSSFMVIYIAKTKADLESEAKGSTATGREAWGDNGNFNYIDTSRITDMANLFENDYDFNGDISSWDVRSVTDMQFMFFEATAFKQNLESWGVQDSADITQMFDGSGVTDLPSWCTFNGSCLSTELTYSSSATFGESETIIPTKTPSQVASYTIEYAKVGTITPPSIDSRGVITTTASTTAGFYSIKAFDGSNSEITTSSFMVIYIAKTKADLESEVKGSTATGREAWGDNGNFNYIDTSRITDMANLFENDYDFNGDISSWDVRSVTDMQFMFFEATAFKQNLESWGVQDSADITQMFDGSGVTDLPSWCTFNGSCLSTELTYSSSATFGESETIIPTKTPSQVASYTIEYAKVGTITPPSIDSRGVITTTASTTAGFYSIKAFDGSNSEITTSSFMVIYIAKTKADLESEVKGSTATGREAWGDNGNFNYIDTSRITDMANLFENDYDFNGDISSWDVSSVTDMFAMFYIAITFNGDISSWDVGNVTNMVYMFGHTVFNQNISNWDVKSVTDMTAMFIAAKVFNQDLDNWGEKLQGAKITGMFYNSGIAPLPTWCNSESNCY